MLLLALVVQQLSPQLPRFKFKKKSNVAVPTITFLATANCTQFSHDCNINFVDTEKNSACISVEHLEKF